MQTAYTLFGKSYYKAILVAIWLEVAMDILT